jgi:hypothetical protein
MHVGVVVSPFIGPTPLFGPGGGSATSCIWIHMPTPAELQAAGGRNISLEPPGTGTVTHDHNVKVWANLLTNYN